MIRINFMRLGVFAFLLLCAATSAAQNLIFYPYDAVSTPVVNTDLSAAKPIGVGSVALGGGTIDIRVSTAAFTVPMDVYLGIFAPHISSEIYCFGSDNTLQPLSFETRPWKPGVIGVSESLFGGVEVSALPRGTYFLYLLVCPENGTTNFTLWGTFFTISAAGPPPSLGTASIVSGMIERIGSVVVNGVEFETPEGIEVEFERDEVGDPTRFQAGMGIEVEGEIQDNGITGRATRIKFKDELEGPITEIEDTTPELLKRVTVMGQTVIVEDGATHFDNRDAAFGFGTMIPGQVVEVDGFRRDDDSIPATFMRRKADDMATFLAGGDDLEVKGIVTGLTGNTFRIGNLTVNFAGVTPRNGVLANGVLVEVKGFFFNTDTSTLTAADVEVRPFGLGVDDIAKAKVEGLITMLDTANRIFRVNGQLVGFSGARFRGGPEADLTNGIRVQAEGPIAGGVLQALWVDFKESIRFEANADVVDSANNILTLQYLPSVTVVVDDSFTDFGDVSALAGISPGNNLKIRGRVNSSTIPGSRFVVATRLELVNTNPSNQTILQGPVDSFSATAGIVSIIGISVNTYAVRNEDFRIENFSIGRAAFFNSIGVGNIVKARIRDGVWDQIEIEFD